MFLKKRNILAACAALVAGMVIMFSPGNAGSAAGFSEFMGMQTQDLPSYRLSFYNLHTHEKLNVAYRDGRYYRPEALRSVNSLLRDHRNGGVHRIDARLLDVLYGLKSTLEARHPGLDVRFNVISGYRSSGSNELLRRAGGAQAKHSQHIEGKAIDIRVPGVDLTELRNAAWCLGAGGVGYYRSEDFIHVDTGKRRFWNWSPRNERVRCGGDDRYALNE
jgi:uncharacterized protein YcbK (DUF882 family)